MARHMICDGAFFGESPASERPYVHPMFCMDIKQLAVSLGNPRLPVQKDGEHNALDDARWNKEAYEFLRPTDASPEKP